VHRERKVVVRWPDGEEQLPAGFPGIRAGRVTKLKEPRTAERKFEEVVKDAEQAAVLVLVY